jgi:hypothetical protein
MGAGFPLIRHDVVDLQSDAGVLRGREQIPRRHARKHRPSAPETDFLAEKDFFDRYQRGCIG